MRTLIIGFASLLFITILVIGGIYFYVNRPGDPINLKQTTYTLKKDQQIVNEEESVYKSVGNGGDHEGGGFLPTNVKSIAQDNSDPKTVLKYFFTALMMKNPNIFMPYMDGVVLSKDLFKSKNPNKTEVIKSYMKQLSHNFTIKKVSILNENSSINQNIVFKVRVTYAKNISRRLIIVLDDYAPTHYNGAPLYYVKTSLLSLIKQAK